MTSMALRGMFETIAMTCRKLMPSSSDEASQIASVSAVVTASFSAAFAA